MTILPSAPRWMLVSRPADPEACTAYIRDLRDPRAIFAWFHRRVVLSAADIPGDVVRKAMKATAAVDGRTLRRLANSAAAEQSMPASFVAASLLVNRRVDYESVARTPMQFGAARDNFERTMGLLSERTVPASVHEAFRIMVAKQKIAAILNTAGHAELATVMGLNVSRFMKRIRSNLHGTAFRGFTQNWTASIGHLVVLAYLVKGQGAGLLDFRGVKVWEGPVANRFLWDRLCGLSSDVEMVPRWSTFADNHLSVHFEWIDDRFVDYFEACGIVADRAGDAHGAIMERPSLDHPALARFREAVGFGPDDRIVTVHGREAGFRAGGGHDLRNLDIDAYRPALAALVRQGYRVVRLGDRSMTPLPAMDGVVDYAVSRLKSAELDILLPAAAAFHIGSSSGLSLVPLLFGTPCLFLNWHPFDLLPWGRRNWTVLKPIEALADGRRVTDRATYARLGRIRERCLLNAFGYALPELDPQAVERAIAGFVASLAPDAPRPAATGRNAGRVLVLDDGGALRDLV